MDESNPDNTWSFFFVAMKKKKLKSLGIVIRLFIAMMNGPLKADAADFGKYFLSPLKRNFMILCSINK